MLLLFFGYVFVTKSSQRPIGHERLILTCRVNSLRPKLTKYSDTLKQFVGCCQRII